MGWGYDKYALRLHTLELHTLILTIFAVHGIICKYD